METNSIFTCADHREFLSRCLKEGKKPLGVRGLARKAGFKSAGHVTMIVNGKRKLSSRYADLLARALTLKGRQRSLLLAFARLDSARTEKEKAIARDEIIRLKSFRPEFKLNAAQYSFLAVWYYPVLYALLQNLPGPTSPETLAKRLGRGVTAAQVTEALSGLLLLGLIEEGANGAYTPLHAAISTPDELRNLAAAKYHRNSLALAEEALALPLEKREFNGLTVAVPERLLPQVKARIRAFRSELNELLSRETEDAEVHQLNIQFFPLTSRGTES